MQVRIIIEFCFFTSDQEKISTHIFIILQKFLSCSSAGPPTRPLHRSALHETQLCVSSKRCVVFAVSFSMGAISCNLYNPHRSSFTVAWLTTPIACHFVRWTPKHQVALPAHFHIQVTAFISSQLVVYSMVWPMTSPQSLPTLRVLFLPNSVFCVQPYHLLCGLIPTCLKAARP